MAKIKQDKERLRSVAEQITTALQERGHGRHFRQNYVARPGKTNTDGWYYNLGRLGRGKPSLEVWLDRYPARNRRRFWWGFFSTNPKSNSSHLWLMKRLPLLLKPTLPMRTVDDFTEIGRFSCLKQPLKRQEFSQPIEERYKIERFYGIYDNTPASDKIIVKRAVDFFGRVLCHLYGTAPVASDIDSDGLPARVKQTINRIVRDTKMSLAIKQLYGNRCQVCGKRLEIEPGEFYAEGHHLKPLGGEHQGPDLRGNLLCLCPNHHALFDYFAMPLNPARLKLNKHKLGQSFIDYHNSRVSML